MEEKSIIRKRILIIDDDEHNVELLSEKLKVKYSLYAAYNGNDGIEIAYKELPDLIILDLLLPGINGFEVSKILSSDPRTANIPVIMLTSVYITESDINAGLQLGAKKFMLKADVFLSKPCDYKELLDNIEILFGEKKEIVKEIRKPYLLIIDDDKNNAELLKIRLAAEYEIAEAGDGEIGLKMIDEREPDMILLDIKMPGRTGREILKDISKKYPDIGVIMMTAYGSENIAVETLKNGAIDYIPKPIDHRNILARVKECHEKNLLRVRNNHLIAQIKESNISQMRRYEEMEVLCRRLELADEEKQNLIEELKRRNEELLKFQKIVIGRELRFSEIKKLLKETYSVLKECSCADEPAFKIILDKLNDEFLKQTE